jgi:hypothetical protein
MAKKSKNAMHGTTSLIITLLILMLPAVAGAQLLGQVSTARTLPPKTNDLGGYLGVFDNVTTFFGQYRRGLNSNLDFGVQLGLIDHDAQDSDASLIFGGDLKYGVMSTRTDPLDMAIGGRTMFYDVGPLSVFTVGGSVILSRDYRLRQGSFISPYGAVNIRLESISFDRGDSHGGGNAETGYDDTDLDIGGVAGVKWELSDLIDALGEIVIDDDSGLILGLNFKL